MFKLKFIALGYPNSKTFDYNDEKEYCSVILWLEDQKIRHYAIEDREGLSKIERDVWNDAFNAYQQELVSPVVAGTPVEHLHWLLSYAVHLEYADNVDKYKDSEAVQKQAAPNIVSSNPLDTLNFQSQAFKDEVDRLCSLASVGPHPDNKERVTALAKILKPHKLRENHYTAACRSFQSALCAELS